VPNFIIQGIITEKNYKLIKHHKQINLKNKTPKATTYAKRLLEQLVNCAATTRLDMGSATKLE
jgi:hypothetical protein